MRTRTTLIVMVLVTAAAVSGCGIRTSAPVEFDDGTGCTYIQSVLDRVNAVEVLRVKVRDCAQPRSDEQTEHIAGLVWRSLRGPVDLVEIDTSMHTSPVGFRGADLAARYQVGSLPRVPRPAGAVASDLLWLLLPTAYLAAFAAMVGAVRRLRRAGIVLIVFRS